MPKNKYMSMPLTDIISLVVSGIPDEDYNDIMSALIIASFVEKKKAMLDLPKLDESNFSIYKDRFRKTFTES